MHFPDYLWCCMPFMNCLLCSAPVYFIPALYSQVTYTLFQSVVFFSFHWSIKCMSFNFCFCIFFIQTLKFFIQWNHRIFFCMPFLLQEYNHFAFFLYFIFKIVVKYTYVQFTVFTLLGLQFSGIKHTHVVTQPSPPPICRIFPSSRIETVLS